MCALNLLSRRRLPPFSSLLSCITIALRWLAEISTDLLPRFLLLRLRFLPLLPLMPLSPCFSCALCVMLVPKRSKNSASNCSFLDSCSLHRWGSLRNLKFSKSNTDPQVRLIRQGRRTVLSYSTVVSDAILHQGRDDPNKSIQSGSRSTVTSIRASEKWLHLLCQLELLRHTVLLPALSKGRTYSASWSFSEVQYCYQR